MRSLLVRVLIVLGLAVLAGPVSAHDHEPPPPARLKVEGQTQKGRLIYTKWFSKSDDECRVHETSAADTYPQPMQVSRGEHVARVRLARPSRPAFVDITTWHGGSSNGPTGPSSEPPHELMPIRRDGRVIAYRVVFDVTVVKNLFIRVAVVWPDRENCISGGGDGQHAYWNFHLEASL